MLADPVRRARLEALAEALDCVTSVDCEVAAKHLMMRGNVVQTIDPNAAKHLFHVAGALRRLAGVVGR